MRVSDVDVTGRVKWSRLPPEVREERLSLARAIYGPGFDELPEISLLWGACNVHLVIDDQDPLAKTFACSICLDRLFVHGPDCTAWFCTCEAAVPIEAKHWFARLYSRRGRKLDRNAEEKEKFDRYLRTRVNGVRIREAVNKILDAVEAAPID